jgi:alanine racemase
MVKGNAYGHDAVWAFETLHASPKVVKFGVATLSEALKIREETRIPLSRQKDIIVFSEYWVWTEKLAKTLKRLKIEPVFYSREMWDAWIRFHRKSGIVLPFHLEWNTGMNRLGMDFDRDYPVVKAALERAAPLRKNFISAFTHFAQSERPDSELSRKQRAGFQKLAAIFRADFPEVLLHFANSGGLWRSAEYSDLIALSDWARPGVSLYGAPPISGESSRGLVPVMELESRVLRVFHVEKGETVGYSGLHRVEKSEGETIAVLGTGYADGVHRVSTGKGFAIDAKGKKRAFLGRVSMDLIAVEGAGLRAGDWVRFWSDAESLWEFSKACETIPYEVWTSVSQRVYRK